MSEAQALPNGWEVVKLSDVGTFKSGSGFPINAQGKTSGRYPFFKVSDFSNDGNERSLNRANHYIDEDDRRRISARVFPAGTIAFAKIGAAIFLERKRLIDQESCLDNNMAGYILQNGQVSRDLVLANLQQFSLGSLVASTALPAIGSGDLKSISFAMPTSSEEQRAIAAALSDADGVVAGLERLIAKKRLIKQGAMQDLLTARRRLPGFTDAWEAKRLGDLLTSVTGGGTPSRTRTEFWDGQIPWMTVKDFATGAVNATLESITGDGLKNSSSRLVAAGTLILCTRMAVGKTTIMNVDVAINQDLKALLFKTGVSVSFMKRVFEVLQNKIEENAGGSTVKGISIGDVRGLELMLPPFDEQRAIAAVLSDMDAEIQTLDARLTKARAVKEGMMQNLLTGRVRLV